VQLHDNNVRLTELFVDKWKSIINDVDITDIPVEYIDHLVVHTEDDSEYIVSIIDLLKQGIQASELEMTLENKMEEFEDEIISVDYILNIDKISTDIQLTTDETLKNL
tara:strand:+ start:402 stop:725 length:324 start_codon:yes stop_codon:yes gene_type:complete